VAPALKYGSRHTSAATARQIASRLRFWKITSARGLVAILPSTTATASGTKRLSVPRSEMASKPVTSNATSKAARTHTGRGRSVISSIGRWIARKAMRKKTSEPSRLLSSFWTR